MMSSYIINIWIGLRNSSRSNWLTDNQRILKDKLKVLNTLQMEMLEVKRTFHFHKISNVKSGPHDHLKKFR